MMKYVFIAVERYIFISYKIAMIFDNSMIRNNIAADVHRYCSSESIWN